jgi:hypothetical protein
MYHELSSDDPLCSTSNREQQVDKDTLYQDEDLEDELHCTAPDV